ATAVLTRAQFPPYSAPTERSRTAMTTPAQRSALMAGYRMLDLSDEKGMLCAKIFADMGVEGLKVERPGGDPARSLPPFHQDEPDAAKSLLWFAYNDGRKSATLDLATADGRAVFQDLVKVSDVVLESFPIGYLDSLGLGYEALFRLNPRIILTSLTPFGDTGPGRDQQAEDVVLWATGGM